MKKFLVTILALVYLTVSCGATVQIHYCMGNLVHWNLWTSIDKNCSKCGMKKVTKKHNGCCKDDHKHIKLIQDQNINNALQMVQLFATGFPVRLLLFPDYTFISVAKNTLGIHSPPRSSGIHIHIRNCVFLI